MLDWSHLARKIESSTRTSEKTRLLADAMRSASDAELAPLCRVLGSVPLDQALNIGWAGIARAVEEVAGAPDGSLAKLMDESGDLGVAVEELLESERPIAGPAAEEDERTRAAERRIREAAAGEGVTSGSTRPPALSDLEETLATIGASSGQRRHDLLVQYLYRSTPLVARYLVRMLSGGVRIGLRDGLLEGAIAEAFSVPLADVRRAMLLEGDPGRVAQFAREGRIADASLRYFRAIPPALALQALVLTEALERFSEAGEEELLAEEKYDGVRAQLHIADGRAALYGRESAEISVAFPEIIAAALEYGRERNVRAIFDGEIVALQDGERLPSDRIHARLRGHETTLREREQTGVQLIVFDLLGQDERLLVDHPLVERRRALAELAIAKASAGSIAEARSWQVRTSGEIEQALLEAQMQGSEGLVLKSLASPYGAGRRSSSWIKVKRSAHSIECVVVGADLGLGKRQHLLTELTFAVRDDLSGRLTTIGRASAPQSLDEVAWLNRWFEDHTVAQLGRYRSVEPRLVIEVRYDELRRSERTTSGYRLRNPRIVRVRHDLGPDQTATLSSLEARAGQAGAQGGERDG